MTLREFTAVYERDGDWWVAWAEELIARSPRERPVLLESEPEAGNGA